MHRSHNRTAILCLTPFVLAACNSGGRQLAYVERLGDDTLAIEVFTRTNNQIEGSLLMRSPVTRVVRYSADISPEGTITHMVAQASTPPENPGGPPPQDVEVTIEGDSATAVVQRGDSTETIVVPVTPGAIPAVSRLHVQVPVVQQAIMQLQRSGADSIPLTFLPLGGRREQNNFLVRRGGDTVQWDFFGYPVYARADADGRVVSVSGRETTLKTETELVESVDFEQLAAEFAARDARGNGIGVASPRDTVTVTAGGGARFEVDYSRPAMRGRAIWGALVPFGTIWRTGANAATHFTTNRDIVVRNARLARGTYTLWTTFTQDGGTLVINAQTGIWGTAYDSTHDVARVPLDRDSLPEPVERFTIGIDSTAQGGVLELAWDRTQFSVPLRVRR